MRSKCGLEVGGNGRPSLKATFSSTRARERMPGMTVDTPGSLRANRVAASARVAKYGAHTRFSASTRARVSANRPSRNMVCCCDPGCQVA